MKPGQKFFDKHIVVNKNQIQNLLATKRALYATDILGITKEDKEIRYVPEMKANKKIICLIMVYYV